MIDKVKIVYKYDTVRMMWHGNREYSNGRIWLAYIYSVTN